MTTQIYLGNPNQSIVKFIKDHYTPLTFTSTGDTKILFGKCISRWDDTVGREIMVPVDSQPTDGVKLEYSVNNEEWSNYSLANIIELSDGQIVRFRATDAGNSTINVGMSSIWDGVYAFSVSGTGTVAASGNIQSLLDKTCQRMDVPADCYCYMFYGCSALTAAPALPATTLADSCYSNMFSGCSSLTQAPALPATTLADSCYSNMFY